MRPIDIVLLGQAVPPVPPPPAHTVTLSPSGFHDSSTTSTSFSTTFAATITGGTPTSITWSITSQVNATVTLNGGQGTTSANFTLTISDTSTPPDSGSCNIVCTAVFSDGTVADTAGMSATYLGPPI